MIDLRNYKDYIRELVAEENKKDKNWRWSVKSIGKSLVRIRWGYLDYLEEKENCFLLSMYGRGRRRLAMGQEARRRTDRMLSGSGGQAEPAAWRGADNQKRPAGRSLGNRLYRP